MRRTFLLGTVAAASIALLAACNKTNDTTPAPAPAPSAETDTTTTTTTTAENTTPAPGTNNETVSAVQDAVSGAVGSVAAATTTSTQGFVEAAAISDMYEVAAAKIALQRSQRDDVKAFAQKMLDAHTKTSRELKSLLASGNINVQVPTALDDRHKGMIDNLTGADDKDFDARYIDQQEMAHNQAETLFKTYADHGDNTDLKQFASNTVTAIDSHLKMAHDLDKADDNQGSNAPTQ
jgi:putative membrane protein